jgi:hypothetical protein
MVEDQRRTVLVWNGVHSVQLGSYLEEKVAALFYKADNMAVRICRADNVTPSIRKKLALTSPTSGGRSVDKVCSRTQATELVWF